jgi:diacylglycerol kinase family enzyme
MEVILIKMPRDLIELSDITSGILSGTFKSHQIEKYSAHKIKFELDENVHWTLDGEYEKGSGICEIDTMESAISLIK